MRGWLFVDTRPPDGLTDRAGLERITLHELFVAFSVIGDLLMLLSPLLLGSAPDKAKGHDRGDRAAAVIFWRGATVTLARERVESPVANERSDESDTPGSLAEGSGSLLEPLLPSGAEAGEPVLPGKGQRGAVPGFSVGNVSLEVRRGEVRQK